MKLKNYLFILITKIVSKNPYISLTLLKLVYVVIPKKISEKMFDLFNEKL